MLSLFNFLARVIGFIFFIVSGGMGIFLLKHPDDNAPWFFTPMLFIVAILGLLMVFARGYKPDKDDE
jgi:hypothetical protein